MRTTEVTVTEEALVVEPLGWNKLWSFTRRLRIPLGQVRSATFEPGTEPTGGRAPGLHLPGRAQGTFHGLRGRHFWNTAGHDRTIVVTLTTGERYDRLVVSVDDPRQVVATINAAVAAGRRRAGLPVAPTHRSKNASSRRRVRIIRRPLETLKDNLRPYVVLNVVSFGLFFGGLVVGSIWPGTSRDAGAVLDTFAGMSPASASALGAVNDGQVWLLAAIILSANILFGGLLMAIVPSLVVPFSGLVIHGVFAGLLGLMFAPLSGQHVFLVHLPTMVVELAAYVFFMLGVYRLGVDLVLGESRRFDSRSAAYRHGLVDLSWLCIPAIVLLVLGAVYEAFEVTVLLGPQNP